MEQIISNPGTLRNYSDQFDNILENANVTIPKNLVLKDFLSRKGRSILSASQSSAAIQNLFRILSKNTRTEIHNNITSGIYHHQTLMSCL